MKYGFLLGSNAFFTDEPVITYTAGDRTNELLRIKSVYHPGGKGQEAKSLEIETHVKGVHDHNVIIADNNYQHPEHTITVHPNQIHITGSDGHTILDVLQLEPEAIPGLSSHVLNEYNTMGEVIFIRLRGDFMVGEHRITIDNEKFSVDDDVYAESVHVVHGRGITLGANGVTF